VAGLDPATHAFCRASHRGCLGMGHLRRDGPHQPASLHAPGYVGRGPWECGKIPRLRFSMTQTYSWWSTLAPMASADIGRRFARR